MEQQEGILHHSPQEEDEGISMKPEHLTEKDKEKIDKIVSELAEAYNKATVELAAFLAERRHLKEVGVKEVRDAAEIVYPHHLWKKWLRWPWK